MFRKLTALVLVAFLALPACSFAKTNPNSVQALQSDGRTFCTVWSLNEAEGLWSTEAHCAAYVIEKELEVTIMGQPAWIEFIGFPSVDIAVFRSDAHASALKLAKTAPQVGDSISVVGYPNGITRTRTEGHVAAINIPIQHPSTGYYMTSDILDITTTGGNSGSPVMNSKGEVIETLWGGFTESNHSLGTSYANTMRALTPFVS